MSTNSCSAFEERIDDLGIEVDAALLENDRLGDVVREGVLVNAFGGQRIVDVGECHDPAAQGNLIANQALRVAAAVVPLVVGQRNVVGHAKEFRVRLVTGRRGQRLRANADVRLHDLEFFVSQRSPFQKNAVLNSHLADVMQGLVR